jgi:hypothetical protein
MLLSVKGTFQDGVARPAESVEGRDGQPVVIIFLEEDHNGSTLLEDGPAWDALTHLVRDCAVETGIADLAHQHDHYLYRKARRE